LDAAARVCTADAELPSFMANTDICDATANSSAYKCEQIHSTSSVLLKEEGLSLEVLQALIDGNFP